MLKLGIKLLHNCALGLQRAGGVGAGQAHQCSDSVGEAGETVLWRRGESPGGAGWLCRLPGSVA